METVRKMKGQIVILLINNKAEDLFYSQFWGLSCVCLRLRKLHPKGENKNPLESAEVDSTKRALRSRQITYQQKAKTAVNANVIPQPSYENRWRQTSEVALIEKKPWFSCAREIGIGQAQTIPISRSRLKAFSHFCLLLNDLIKQLQGQATACFDSQQNQKPSRQTRIYPLQPRMNDRQFTGYIEVVSLLIQAGLYKVLTNKPFKRPI